MAQLARSWLRLAALFSLIAPLVVAACQAGPGSSNGVGAGPPAGAAGSADTDAFGPGGRCDIEALMARPENGCTSAGCHGERFQGNLDLLSPGLERRLVGVPSQSEACSGELLVDPGHPDRSLLLRLIDPARFAASPCGVMMPFGTQAGVSPAALSCFEDWVNALAQQTSASDQPVSDFEPVAPASYVNKVKTLLIGHAATADEVAKVAATPDALKDSIRDWLRTPEFADNLSDFLRVALQQKLIGTFDSQFARLRGNGTQLAAFEQNLQESFVRTARDIVLSGRPFTEVLTTHRWAATSATLSALAYLDRTEKELSAEKHAIVREPGPDMPPAPLPLDYSVSNRVWQIAGLPAECDATPINADQLFDMMLGFVRCKGTGAGNYRFTDSVLTDEDFGDWRFVDIRTARDGEAAPLFYDLNALRGASEISLRLPRVGFFTTPAFLANWETNEDNQFRVTTSQTLITALGKIFSPADSTQPLRLDGLARDHAAPGTTCYGCHQFLDPMREYFAQSFSYDFRRPEKPGSITPSFAFQGYLHDGGTLDDFAQALAAHPDFAGAWAQKLCYWANSQACNERDAEFVRVTRAFQDSHFDFQTLLVELLSSPLVTGATPLDAAGESLPISITRKQHLCQLLDARLGTSNTCGVAASFAGLVPEDDFSRGAAEPVLTAVTGLFHYAAAEKLCARVATKLIGSAAGMPFKPQDAESALEIFVSQLMGLDAGSARHDAVLASLQDHFQNAKTSTNTTTALRSAFIVACVSPEVQALGL